jgi:hypothetical protein
MISREIGGRQNVEKRADDKKGVEMGDRVACVGDV